MITYRFEHSTCRCDVPAVENLRKERTFFVYKINVNVQKDLTLAMTLQSRFSNFILHDCGKSELNSFCLHYESNCKALKLSQNNFVSFYVFTYVIIYSSRMIQTHDINLGIQLFSKIIFTKILMYVKSSVK